MRLACPGEVNFRRRSAERGGRLRSTSSREEEVERLSNLGAMSS